MVVGQGSLLDVHEVLVVWAYMNDLVNCMIFQIAKRKMSGRTKRRIKEEDEEDVSDPKPNMTVKKR